MQKRKLGNSSLEVAPLMLGGNVFGWTADEKSSFEVLDAFSDAGFNFIDTADYYSIWAEGHKGGESETVIGKWMKLRGNRDKLIIATKVGLKMGEGKEGLSAKYIRVAVEDSLRRLQTDHIDLYQSHRDDPNTPQEETLQVYAELVKAGKVRVIGASNYSAERLKEALEISAKNNWPRYESLQPLYNLYSRSEFEKEVQPLCVEKNIGVIPYYGLSSGFLTGKYRSENDFSKSLRGKSMNRFFNERGMKILGGLDEVAKRYRTTPAIVAIAWLMAQPAITAPIVSATNVVQLKENISAVGIQLDNEAMEILNKASA